MSLLRSVQSVETSHAISLEDESQANCRRKLQSQLLGSIVFICPGHSHLLRTSSQTWSPTPPVLHCIHCLAGGVGSRRKEKAGPQP